MSLPEEEVIDEPQQIEEALVKIEANLSNYVTEIAKLKAELPILIIYSTSYSLYSYYWF